MMHASNGRAIGSVILAIFALVATLYVLDENMISTHESAAKDENDLIGNDLLESEANALDTLRDFDNQGKNVASEFKMLHDFTKPGEDKEFTATLEANAPKQSDLDLALSPDKLGLIKYHGGKAYFGDDQDDQSLLQINDDWEPKGQEGMADQIAAAKAEDEKAQFKADGLEDDVLLNAVAERNKADSFETIFVQQDAGDDAKWKPSGQQDLESSIDAAKASDEAAQVKADGLEGTGLLSSAGVTRGQDDDDDDFAEEMVFVQEPEWTPHGQAGMSEEIKSAEAEDDQAQIKADGLKGTGLLSALGMHNAREEENEELLQNQDAKQDAVAGWNPKGQKIEDHHYDEDEEKLQEEKPWDKPDDGLYGDDILSAVNMGDHKKKSGEDELGAITADDLGLDDLLK
jgi:hypothetical protein